jgi:hypothetical protein
LGSAGDGAKLGIPGEVPHQNDFVEAGHGFSLFMDECARAGLAGEVREVPRDQDYTTLRQAGEQSALGCCLPYRARSTMH